MALNFFSRSVSSFRTCKWGLIFGLLLWEMAPLPGQYSDENLNLISSENGLNTREGISFISWDKFGFTWMAGTKSLYRFDGSKIRKEFGQSGFLESESDNFFQSKLIEVPNGMIWFTTYNCLHRYDPRLNSFQSFPISHKGEKYHENYRLIALDEKEQFLYLRAGDRIFQLDVNYPDQPLPISEESTHGMYFALENDHEGNAVRIWAAPWTANAGVELFEKKDSGQYESWEKREYLRKADNSELPERLSICNTLVENDSITWHFSTRGLIRLNHMDSSWALYNPTFGQYLKTKGGVWKDSTTLWVGTHSKGLWEFNIHTKEFSKGLHRGQERPLLDEDDFKTLELDSRTAAEPWISTERGVLYPEHPPLPFVRIQGNRFEGNDVFHIQELDSGQVLISIREEGVFLIAESGEFLAHYPGSDFKGQDVFQFKKLADDQVWAMCQGGIFSLTPKGWKPIDIEGNHRFRGLEQLPSETVVVTTENGLYYLKPSDNRWAAEMVPGLDTLQALGISRLLLSPSGKLLLPYNSRELWVLEEDARANLALIRRVKLPVYVYDIARGTNSNLVFFGTAKGLYVFDDLAMGEPELAVQEGPKGDIGPVYTVVPDDKDNVWLGTEEGLWKYELEGGRLFHFQREDGLFSESFSAHAGMMSQARQIWMGTQQGPIKFNPEEILPFSEPPRAYIEDLTVGGISYNPSDTSLLALQRLELEHDKAPFALELRAVDYFRPQKSMLRYRLIDSEIYGNWQWIGNGELAKFPNLDPGEYNMEIQAVNAHGQVGETRFLDIHIWVPFFETIWFRIILAGIVLLVLFLLFRARYKQQLHQKELLIEKERTQNEERNRIAQELHDDMGGALSSMIYMTRGLIREEDQPEKREKLARMASSSNELIEKMEEIIWALNIEHDDVESLSFELRRSASEYLSQNEIQVQIEIPDQFPEISIGGERRRNIYLILKECLHNIVKHARAYWVSFSIEVKKGVYRLTIEDDGIGFDPKQTDSKRNGMRNLRKRAEALNAKLDVKSVPGKGTRIVLEVPL